MVKMFYLTVVSALMASTVCADSIRVGNKHYRGVYISSTANYYILHLPEEGRTERISRRRSDVSEPQIDSNGTRRAGLLAKYRARKGERDLPGTSASNVLSPSPVKQAVQTIDGEVFLIQKRLRDLAVFESQLAHWQSLSEEAQQDIQLHLHETLVRRTEGRVAAHEQVAAQLEQLGQKKATVEGQLESAAYVREDAVRRAVDESEESYYLRAYENSRVLVGPVYQYYYDHRDNIRAYPIYWYEQDASLYDAAAIERARRQGRIGAAEHVYTNEVRTHTSVLNSVEGKIRRRAWDNYAVISKSHDERQRYGGFQARVDALIEATAADHRPQLDSAIVASWAGVETQRTESFRVGRGIWRLDCKRQNEGSPRSFSITIVDAESGKPFTRMAGADFLGMRMRVFDEPGTYYLEVEQAIERVPYEITVSTLRQQR